MNPILLVASLVFGCFVLFFIVYSGFLVYHLYEFSLNAKSAKLLASTYLIVFVVLLSGVLFYVLGIDWNAPVFPGY